MMTKMQNPTSGAMVTVIMPAYNAERYIEEAVRSVMAQTFPYWELIIIDDGSRDATVEIAERMAGEDSRITLLRNEVNMGVAKTRNRGLDLAEGSYVALLDSDDIWYPEKLERQVALAQKTNAGIVYCSYAIVDEYGQKKCEDFVVPEKTDFSKAIIQSVISCSTALLSREVVERYRFDTAYYHEDLALWLSILRDGYTAGGVTEILAAYRVMEGTRASNKLRTAAHRWTIYRKLLGCSVLRSCKLLLQYGMLGMKKYKSVQQ